MQGLIDSFGEEGMQLPLAQHNYQNAGHQGY